MLETVRLLAAGRKRPKRSVLFVAVIAKEKGLLRAYHFAAQPTVPGESLVANVNMDMPLVIGDVSDVVPIAASRT
jgi:Zn-dependent M28 family amino/carboxypeptidase